MVLHIFVKFQNWGGMMKNILATLVIFLLSLPLFVAWMSANDPKPATALY